MNNILMINETNLQLKEYQNQRVVTLSDIDKVHKRVDGTARKRFNDNKRHFIKNEDYFEISRKELSTNFGRNSDQPLRGNPNIQVPLFTETGYLLIVKSFTDNLAWKVQRQLVKTYFKAKELQVELDTQNHKNEIINLNSNQLEAIQNFQNDIIFTRHKILSSQFHTIDRYLDNLKDKINNIDIKLSELTIPETLETQNNNNDIPLVVGELIKVNDPIRNIIKPLAIQYNDGSNGYNCTFRKVYKNMGVDWKNRSTRYKRTKGVKNVSNFTLIEKDSKLLKLFIKTVNLMLKEIEN